MIENQLDFIGNMLINYVQKSDYQNTEKILKENPHLDLI